MSDASSSRALQCVIVTPEATVREGSAQFVAVPLFDGELGIAPLHSPMIGRLGYGELRILDGGKTERLYVDGGFVQVTGNTVYILTNRAIPADKLDRNSAEEQLKSARTKPANTAELLAVRERQISQARAQLRVVARS